MGHYYYLIIILLFLPYSSCQIGFQGLLPPSISPPLIPDLLNFLDQRLAIVYPIIKTFKSLIVSDPLNITGTWVGSDICNYKGFHCDNPPDNATATVLASIDFNGFHLSAPSLDGFIDQLPDLALFHANSNNFSGTISPNIAKLQYLYELDLSNNNFFGGIPQVLLSMPGISFLDLRFNSFSGSVPPQLFIVKLDALFLNNNNFIQTLPESLGSIPAYYITLANNKFTGPIPRSIGKASDTLTEVLLLNNLLSGCLPYELGFLRELTFFDAGNNLLTGPLPWSLGCLKKVEVVNLAGNMLYGQVPEVLCELENLVNLSLSNNYFNKVGPWCHRLIVNGALDVRNNCIYGLAHQRPWGECSLFFRQPRFCDRLSTFNIIPCRGGSLSQNSNNSTSPRKQRTSNSVSVTYKALLRNRL
ncbi:hypothetical protein ACFE04_003107 [Oxalis oulophora]